MSEMRTELDEVVFEMAEIKAEIATLKTMRNRGWLTDHRRSEITNELIANINDKVALTNKEVELLKRFPGKIVETLDYDKFVARFMFLSYIFSPSDLFWAISESSTYSQMAILILWWSEFHHQNNSASITSLSSYFPSSTRSFLYGDKMHGIDS